MADTIRDRIYTVLGTTIQTSDDYMMMGGPEPQILGIENACEQIVRIISASQLEILEVASEKVVEIAKQIWEAHNCKDTTKVFELTQRLAKLGGYKK